MKPHVHECLIRMFTHAPDRLAEWAKEITQDQVPELLEAAKRDRVFPQAYASLSPFFQIEEEYQTYYQNYRTLKRRIHETVQLLSRELPAGIDMAVIKSCGIEYYYPPYLERHYHDLDVCVRSLDDFWNLDKFLSGHEFEQYTTMTLFQESASQRIMGGARFDYVEDPDAGVLVEGLLELHIGSFAIDYGNNMRTYIPWEEFAASVVDLETPGGVTVRTPNREGTLLLYLAELVTRSRITVRDIIDIVYLLKDAGDEINLHAVAKQVKVYKLEASLNRLQEYFQTNTLYEMPRILSDLMKLVGPTPAYVSYFRNHLWPFLKEHSRNPLKQLLFTYLRDKSATWNSADKHLYFLKQTDLRVSAKRFFSNGAYVYLVKLNDLEKPWKWEQIEHFDVLYTPIGCYLASMHAIYSDEELTSLQNKLASE